MLPIDKAQTGTGLGLQFELRALQGEHTQGKSEAKYPAGDAATGAATVLRQRQQRLGFIFREGGVGIQNVDDYGGPSEWRVTLMVPPSGV